MRLALLVLLQRSIVACSQYCRARRSGRVVGNLKTVWWFGEKIATFNFPEGLPRRAPGYFPRRPVWAWIKPAIARARH